MRPLSLFDRLIASPRRPWLTLGVAVVILLLFFSGALLSGSLNETLANGRWRVLLIAPAVIFYILIISPPLQRVGSSVIDSLRPLAPVDDETFDRLVGGGAVVNPHYEWLAFGVGMTLGFAVVLRNFSLAVSWLALYLFISFGLMYGLLAWTIYMSFASTRVISSILSLSLHVDLFDLRPFEAIGHQSLLLALVFIGGATLSLLFSAFDIEALRQPGFWLAYTPMMLVSITIFFLNMRPTHRVLVAAKESQLRAVQERIRRVGGTFAERLDTNQDAGDLAQEITALVALEKRLREAQTWPYNVAMLRTLFVSVLVPIGVALGRLVIDKLIG